MPILTFKRKIATLKRVPSLLFENRCLNTHWTSKNICVKISAPKFTSIPAGRTDRWVI